MLFMILVKASKNSEAGNIPSLALREAMNQYNEDLVKAGVLVMAKELHPTSNSTRILFPEVGEPIIEEGPFEQPTSLIAGFILLDVKNKEEALKWAKKIPDPQGFGEGQVELRQVFE